MKLDPLPGEPGVEWRLRVIGLDSCERPQWFAQGAVKRDSIVRASRGALVDENADLVIALVHHHVLPIPTLEANAEEGSLRRALNFTGMLNSGTLLEAMSAAQVDLLLHGHEHVPHRAHYVGADPFAGRVAILSAGSGTGDATLKGWKLSVCISMSSNWKMTVAYGCVKSVERAGSCASSSTATLVYRCCAPRISGPAASCAGSGATRLARSSVWRCRRGRLDCTKWWSSAQP